MLPKMAVSQLFFGLVAFITIIGPPNVSAAAMRNHLLLMCMNAAGMTLIVCYVYVI